MSRRSGMTLVELFFAILIAAVLLVAAMNMVAGARRAEYRTNQAVDVAEEVGQAAGWIYRDLTALEHEAGEVPVKVDDVGGVPESRMTFRIREADESATITYRFDASTGELARSGPSGVLRFQLGRGASVVFRPVDPSFAGGGAVQLGQYNNRLVYRLTARRDGPLGARTYTLVGAVPYVVKASRDTFRFWNPLPAAAPRA